MFDGVQVCPLSTVNGHSISQGPGLHAREVSLTVSLMHHSTTATTRATPNVVPIMSLTSPLSHHTHTNCSHRPSIIDKRHIDHLSSPRPLSTTVHVQCPRATVYSSSLRFRILASGACVNLHLTVVESLSFLHLPEFLSSTNPYSSAPTFHPPYPLIRAFPFPSPPSLNSANSLC